MEPMTPVPANPSDELDMVLDAAQQAWERGESVLIWVERYPLYTQELTELALMLAQVRLAEEPATADSAAAERLLRRAMDAALSAGN